MKRFLFIYAWGTIILAMSVLLLVGYWLFHPYQVLTFNEGNATISTKTVKSGGYVELRQHGCKLLPVEAVINRQFIDTILYQVPPVTNNRPVECFDRVEYVYIPKALAPGTYYINSVITFKVNPIRHVSYTVKTNTFEIIK